MMYSLFLLGCLGLPFLVQGGFIDMDTPLDKRTTRSFVDGTVYHLIMSDEFNIDNRTFKDGHDPVWTALDKSDDDSSSAGGGSMQFYNSSSVGTVNGSLVVRTTIGRTTWNRYDHIKKKWRTEETYFNSGMLQSWDKFCFTGGIVEVDVIFPGHPFIGGLWPAIWMLGNLGRATYEGSTNNIWPWSYNTCDRSKQEKQKISACNTQNHFGLHPHQGRGATEIDLIEIMTGDSKGFFKSTDPPVGLPYGDMTLQVAPGVEKNRPQPGTLPVRNETLEHGFTKFQAQTWYKGLEYNGNTSINPFFYGTYLAETKPGEPVTRTKKQAFQADAVGVVHQLVPPHFQKMHTFRLEWQPGPGGRVDWFSQGYKRENENGTYYETGDGEGKDWVPVFTLKDKSLKDLMGTQIPNEPSYLILNTAVSSTWGFPFDTPDWCEKCYDCDDPKCACSFHPGFCQTLREGNVAMKVDSIRVYQSSDPSAHVGANHTIGCDPPDFPTREWIKGHEYRYMRNPPFVYEDTHPLRNVQRGGGACKRDADCGSEIEHVNLTEAYETRIQGSSGAPLINKHHRSAKESKREGVELPRGMGRCVQANEMPAFFSAAARMPHKVCMCNPGYTGPHCHAQAHIDDTVSAMAIKMNYSPFNRMSHFQASPFMLVILCSLIAMVLGFLVYHVQGKRRELKELDKPTLRGPKFANANSRTVGENSDLLITGKSI